MAKDDNKCQPEKPRWTFPNPKGITLQGAFPGGRSGASSKLARRALEDPEAVERLINDAFAQAIEDDRRRRENDAMGED